MEREIIKIVTVILLLSVYTYVVIVITRDSVKFKNELEIARLKAKIEGLCHTIRSSIEHIGGPKSKYRCCSKCRCKKPDKDMIWEGIER